MTYTQAYIRMTGTNLNVFKGNDYFTPKGAQVAYIVSRAGSKNRKVFTSFGELDGHTLNSNIFVYADGNGQRLGAHTIVGIVKADGTVIGEVPNHTLAHGVYK